MKPRRLFSVAFVAGLAAAVYLTPSLNESTASRELGIGVSVRDQMSERDVARAKAAGVQTIIDLRPDGEEPGQPGSAAMERAAKRFKMNFAYIPTPHGEIPDDVADRLAREIATAPRPILLYCRSGKRAARVWALASASTWRGGTAQSIADSVRLAGQPVDDLLPRIEARIKGRRVGL